MMKNAFSSLISAQVSRTFLILSALFILTVAAPAQSMAQESGIANDIAILDMQTIMQQSDASESVRKQIDEKRKEYQKEIESLEEKLRSSEKELSKQKSILSGEAFDEKKKEFEKDIINAQKDIQRKRMALERAFREAMAKIRGEVVKLVAEMADEKGIELVLSRQQVVIVGTELDMTESVMEALNKKIKSVSVEITESEE